MSNGQQARAELGARLRELRRGAGLTGRELARLADWDTSRVSRYELGRQMPSEADIRTWCALTDAALQIPDLIASARNIDAAHLEWKRMNSRRLQHRTEKVEAAASVIRGFDSSLVPGLLQTREYATEILRICIEFVGSPEDLDAAVDQRLTRQKSVRQKRRHTHLILAEQAFYTRVGDSSIMTRQLEYLHECTHTPGITLAVIPRTASFIGPAISFFMYDSNEVSIETTSSTLAITQPSEIALYEKIFHRLAVQSLFGAQARELIDAAIAHYNHSDSPD